MRRIIAITSLLLGVVACGRGNDEGRAGRAELVSDPSAPSVYGNPRVTLTPEEIERGRLDGAWRRAVVLDSIRVVETSVDTETFAGISASAANSRSIHLPLHGDVSGASVLKVQVALDRAVFSPGVMDGRWGRNTEEAIYWLQRREGLRATGEMDRATYARLLGLAGSPTRFVVPHRLTEGDVAGPFIRIPEDIYEQAALDCMCYESLSEKLAEMFHATPELLQQLNPGLALDSLRAGQTIQTPAVRDTGIARTEEIAELRISDEGHYVHALDANGRILFHFPSTLGSSYAPSPEGEFEISTIAWDPKWHYQPDLLTGVEDWKEPAMIPPGPNNAVGVVWMALSKPHYGIHGTSAPRTIGYATSHGCVRLTNWDARFLAKRVHPGVPVHFQDVSARRELTAN